MKTVISILLLASLISGCLPTQRVPALDRLVQDPTYEIIIIEEMPCLVVYGNTMMNGITCDWSKWQGNK